MVRARIGAIGLLVAVAVLGAGCGSGSKAGPAGYGAPAPSGSAGSGSAGATTVRLAQDKTYGQLVVDAQGFTVYVFDKDSNAPSKSSCSGGCATTWPAEKVTGKPTATGIQPSLLGTLTLPDGSTQLTINGWPAYRYSHDAKPGDTNGQGINGTWWVVGAGGAKNTTTPGSGSGYGY